MNEFLDKKTEEELESINVKLNSFKGDLDSEEYINLEKEVTQFCLSLMQNKPKDEDSIRKISYIIANFIEYDFDSILEGAFSIAEELGLERKHYRKDTFYKWERMGKLFKKYLSG